MIWYDRSENNKQSEGIFMIIMIDNHDSFTYNINEYLKIITINEKIRIYKNEDINIDMLNSLNPKSVIVSPGPGHPKDYPKLMENLYQIHKQIPILGVCLGFQLLIATFNGRIVNGQKPIHGHVAAIKHDGKGIYQNLPSSFNVTRYHSLIADDTCIPDEFIISAWTVEGNIPMAIRHKSLPIEAVQYHPESILSEFGKEQIANFLTKVGVEVESTYTI